MGNVETSIKLKTHPEVYKPAEDSFLLAENLGVSVGGVVLDMGTGTGLLALVAAEKAKHVLGVDVNLNAVELAKENACVNRIDNVRFRVSDLFSNIRGDERFDCIIFNPPYLPVEENGLLEKAWSGGCGGMQTIRRFVADAPAYLNQGGIIMLLISSVNGINNVCALLREHNLEPEIVANKKLFFEELYVLRCCFSAI